MKWEIIFCLIIGYTESTVNRLSIVMHSKYDALVYELYDLHPQNLIVINRMAKNKPGRSNTIKQLLTTHTVKLIKKDSSCVISFLLIFYPKQKRTLQILTFTLLYHDTVRVYSEVSIALEFLLSCSENVLQTVQRYVNYLSVIYVQ